MDEVRRAFETFDSDGSGSVSLKEAHALLQRELGFSEENTRHMMRVYDRNGDERLNFEEFIWFYWKIQEKCDENKQPSITPEHQTFFSFLFQER